MFDQFLKRIDPLHTWNSFTLVYVHALARVHVLEEAGPALQLVGTVLAGMPPGLAYGGAAQLASTHHTLQLSSTLPFLYPSVARTSPEQYRSIDK